MAMSYIKLYYDFRKTLKSMPDEAAGRLIKAIFDYVVDGTEPELYNGEQYVFLMLQSQLDRDKEAYEKTVARNQENGKNGGRPKKTEKTQENPVGFSETEENRLEPTKSQDKTKTKIKEDKTKTKEEDKDNIREIDNPFAVVDIVRPRFDTLEAFASANIRSLNANSMEELISFVDTLSEDVVIHAIQIGRDNDVPKYSYVKAILNGYVENGVKSLADAKAADEKFKQQKGGGKQSKDNYQQHEYKDSDFDDNFYYDPLKDYGEA